MNAAIPKAALGNPRVFFSRLGYHVGRNGSYEKRLGGGEFPRFHVYIADKGDEVQLSLHIDQKPHTYEGFSAHVGEYDGSEIEQELKRITGSF